MSEVGGPATKPAAHGNGDEPRRSSDEGVLAGIEPAQARQWLRDLDRCHRLAKRPRWEKLLRIPGRLLASAVLNALARHAPQGLRLRVRTFWGDRMEVVLPDQLSTAIYRYRVHDETVCRWLLRYLRPGMVFFDVGAHFGYFSLLGSRLVTDAGQVHSFEPVPATFEVLRRNVLARGNVIPVNQAVHSRNGPLWMNDLGVEYAAYNSTFAPRLQPRELPGIAVRRVEVAATTLDAYVQAAGRSPDLVKIDAESGDLAILEGMGATLRARHPVIVMEVGDLGVPGAPASSAAVSLLKGAGYRALRVRGDDIVEQEEQVTYEYDNLLFVARSSP
jgi:FkbM family methyltransferase